MGSLIRVNTTITKANASIQVANKLLAKIDPVLIPYRKGDKWGFCDIDKRIVIECVFDWVDFFYDGFARIYINGKYNFISKYGKFISQTFFHNARNFNCGFAWVQYSYKQFHANETFINKSGKQFIDNLYFSDLDDFSEGYAAINGGGYIDTDGKIKRGFGKTSFNFKNGCAIVEDYGSDWNAYWFINNKFEIITDSFQNKPNDFCEDLAVISIEVDCMTKYGYIDKFRKSTIPCRFLEANDFIDGYACVKNENNKYGYINKKGNYVIPPVFEYALDFSCGLAAVKLDSKYGYIDNNGKMKIQPIFSKADSFSDGLAKIELNKDDKLVRGFIDIAGNVVIVLQSLKNEEPKTIVVDDEWWESIELHNLNPIPRPLETSCFMNSLFAYLDANGKPCVIDKNGTQYWED